MDDYKLYLDKSNHFQCKLTLEGASVENAHARLVLEGKSRKYLFEGSITPSGECEILIEKLGDLFKDGDAGNMKLEVIADDAYFLPWESHFVTDLSKRVRVEVVTPKEIKKPSVTVSVLSPSKKEFDVLVETVTTKLKKDGINFSNVKTHKPAVTKLVVESMKGCKYQHPLSDVLTHIVQNLI